MEDIDFPVDYKDEPLFDPSSHNQKVTKSNLVNPILLLQEKGLRKFQHAASIQKRLEILAEERLIKKELQQMKCNLPGNPRSTFLVVFSPDGSKVASTHGDHNIYVTDLRTGSCVSVLEGHPRTPWCIAFHPTSNDIVASGCLGGQVRVWDLHGGSEVWSVTTVEPSCVIASLTFHPTERLLVIAINNSLHFWDWSYSQPFAKCSTLSEREKVRYVNFDPHGKLLVTGIANAPGHSLPNWASSRLSSQASAPRLSSAQERERERQLHTRYQALLDQYERLRRRYQELRSRAAELEQNANPDTSQRSFSPGPLDDPTASESPSTAAISPAPPLAIPTTPGPPRDSLLESWDYITPGRPSTGSASVAHWSRPWSRTMLAQRASASSDPHSGDRSRPSTSGADARPRPGENSGNYDSYVAAETSRLTTEFDARVGIRLLSRHIEYMQRICRVHLATARQHHQVIQLQQIRHILEDLQDQIRYLNVCVRDSIDFVANLRAFGELETGSLPNNNNNNNNSNSSGSNVTPSTAPPMNSISTTPQPLTPASIIASVTNSLPMFSSLTPPTLIAPPPLPASSPVPVPSSMEGLSSASGEARLSSIPDIRQQRGNRWPYCRLGCTCRGRMDRSRHSATCVARHGVREDRPPQRRWPFRVSCQPRVAESTRSRLDLGSSTSGSQLAEASRRIAAQFASTAQTNPNGATESTPEAPSTVRSNPYPASRYQRYLHQLQRMNTPPACRLTLRLPARHRIGCGRRRSAETYTTSCPTQNPIASTSPVPFDTTEASTSTSEPPPERPLTGSQDFRPLMERLQSQLRQQRQMSSPITDPASSNIWEHMRTEQPSTSATTRPLAMLRWSRDLLASIREWRRANRREVRSVRMPTRLRSTRSMDSYARFDEDSSDTDSDNNWHANRQNLTIPRLPPDFWGSSGNSDASRAFQSYVSVSSTPTPEERDREARLERNTARERFRYRQLLTMMVDNLASFFSQHGIQATEQGARQQPQNPRGEGVEGGNAAAPDANAGRGQRATVSAPVFGFFPPVNVDPQPGPEENPQPRVFRQRDSSFVILHSQISANHRIQAWDFSKGIIPDITEGALNVVVGESKIHNDASVDVSKDGLILATLVPCAVPYGAQISLHSLEDSRLGHCLARLSLHQAVVSVSLSPTCKHLLVGLAASRAMPGSIESSLMAQMYAIPPSTSAEHTCDRCSPSPCLHGSTPRSLTKVKSVYLAEDQGIASLNCIRWATIPGQGIVLGTNKGQLKLLY